MASKEHLFPHSYYCWRETPAHLTEVAYMMQQKRGAAVTQESSFHIHIILSLETYFHSHQMWERKLLCCVEYSYCETLWGDCDRRVDLWVSLEVPGGVLGWWIPWFVLDNALTLRSDTHVFLQEAGTEGQGSCCHALERLDTMQRMLLLRRETFLGDQLLFPHKGYGTTSKLLCKILVGVFFFFFHKNWSFCCGACGLSLVAMSAVATLQWFRFITAVASLTERGFLGHAGFSSCGAWHGILVSGHGIKSYPLHWQHIPCTGNLLTHWTTRVSPVWAIEHNWTVRLLN